MLCPPPACPSSSTVPAAPSRISRGSPLHVQSLCMRHLQAGEVTRILALNRAYIPARPEDFPCTHSLWCPFASSFLPPVGAALCRLRLAEPRHPGAGARSESARGNLHGAGNLAWLVVSAVI